MAFGLLIFMAIGGVVILVLAAFAFAALFNPNRGQDKEA